MDLWIIVIPLALTMVFGYGVYLLIKKEPRVHPMHEDRVLAAFAASLTMLILGIGFVTYQHTSMNTKITTVSGIAGIIFGGFLARWAFYRYKRYSDANPFS